MLSCQENLAFKQIVFDYQLNPSKEPMSDARKRWQHRFILYLVCKQEREADIHNRKVAAKVDILDLSQNNSERMEKSS